MHGLYPQWTWLRRIFNLEKIFFKNTQRSCFLKRTMSQFEVLAHALGQEFRTTEAILKAEEGLSSSHVPCNYGKRRKRNSRSQSWHPWDPAVLGTEPRKHCATSPVLFILCDYFLRLCQKFPDWLHTHNLPASVSQIAEIGSVRPMPGVGLGGIDLF